MLKKTMLESGFKANSDTNDIRGAVREFIKGCKAEGDNPNKYLREFRCGLCTRTSGKTRGERKEKSAEIGLGDFDSFLDNSFENSDYSRGEFENGKMKFVLTKFNRLYESYELS